MAIAKLFSPVNLDGSQSHVDLLRVTCQDINPVAVDMCYLNTTLWGIPAHLVWGNTLHNTVERSWKNVHWHRVGEDGRQSALAALDLMKNPIVQHEAESTAEPQPSKPFQIGEQFELDLAGLGDCGKEC